MDSALLNLILQHPKRKWAVLGLSLLFVVLFVLPAWDAHRKAATQYATQLGELEEIKLSIVNVSMLRDRVGNDSHASEAPLTIDAEIAEECREKVVRMAFDLGCDTHRVSLSDPLRRDWYQDDNPFNEPKSRDDEDPAYQLESRKLELSVSGSLANLSKLLNGLSRLNRFAVPTDMTLQRERDNDELRLDMKLSLFNLLPIND